MRSSFYIELLGRPGDAARQPMSERRGEGSAGQQEKAGPPQRRADRAVSFRDRLLDKAVQSGPTIGAAAASTERPSASSPLTTFPSPASAATCSARSAELPSPLRRAGTRS